MSTGDDDPKAEGSGTDEQTDGGKTTPQSGRRRRRAVRPPTIEGEATEVSEPQPTDETVAATTEASPEDHAAEMDAKDPDAETASTKTESTGEGPIGEPAAGEPAAGEPAAGELAVGEPAAGELAVGEPAAADDATSGDQPTEQDADTPASAVEAAAGEDEHGEPAAAGEAAEDDTTAETGSGHVPIPTARRASLIGAGLVGALIALAIYLGLYYGGILPQDQSTTMDALVFQSQDLGRRIATLESSAARDAKRNVGKEINEIQSALKELGSDPKNALIKRVRELESSVGTPTGSSDDGSDAASLASRLSALEDKAAQTGSTLAGDAQAQIADLAKRIEALELRPTATGEGGAQVDTSAPIAALSDRISALDKQMQATAAQVADLAKSGSSSAQETLAKLESDLTAMRTQLDKLGGTVSKSAATVDDKLAAFQKSMAERSSNAAQEVARTTAGALATTALIKTVDSGAPYSAELDVLRPLTGDGANLKALEAYADTGVPDLQVLTARFDAVSNDILTAGDTSQNGLVGSLLTSARSLVRVRPTGKVEGDGRGPIVARIEAALQAGDLKAAETEWSALDATAQDVSKTWAGDLKARIAVNDALEKISASLTAALSGEAAETPAKSGKPAADGASIDSSDAESADTKAARTGNGKSDAKSSAAPEPATN